MNSFPSKERNLRRGVVLTSVFLVLALLVSALPQTPAAAATVTCKYKHTVLEGETLSYLGNYYQISWQKIADANRLQPPYAISAGQVLCIPEGSNTTGSSSSTTTGKKSKKEPVLQAILELGSISVGIENFAPKTPYYIRLFPTGEGVSYRIGNFTTNKEGDVAARFRIAPNLPLSREMTVCVKNTWTDAVSCIRVFPPAAYAAFYMGHPCHNKEGR
jgi:LysM repeat protein